MHGCIPLVWCETSPIAAWHYGWIGMVRSALELKRSLISDTPMDRIIVRLQLYVFLASDHRKRPSRVEFWLTLALACSRSASVGRSSPIWQRVSCGFAANLWLHVWFMSPFCSSIMQYHHQRLDSVEYVHYLFAVCLHGNRAKDGQLADPISLDFGVINGKRM